MLIKNEIVLLDQINIDLKQGKTHFQAVVDASIPVIVRPVALATCFTVLGMIPLLWDAFFAAMAVTIMGGADLCHGPDLDCGAGALLYFFRVHELEEADVKKNHHLCNLGANLWFSLDESWQLKSTGSRCR